MSFENLLGELDELQELSKALPATDEKDEKESADTEESGDGEELEMNKSLPAEADSEFVDGTELLKALGDRVDGLESNTASVMSQLIGVVKSQGELIKSLQDKVEKIGSTGAGKKSVTVFQAQKPKMSGEELMTKALSLCETNALTPSEVAIVELSLSGGNPLPEKLLARIQGA